RRSPSEAEHGPRRRRGSARPRGFTADRSGGAVVEVDARYGRWMRRTGTVTSTKARSTLSPSAPVVPLAAALVALVALLAPGASAQPAGAERIALSVGESVVLPLGDRIARINEADTSVVGYYLNAGNRLELVGRAGGSTPLL